MIQSLQHTKPEKQMQTSYAVMNKATGQLFAGFDADNQPMWTDDERKARAYSDKSDARGQALLFMSFGIKAQQKPVAL
jgi:hypothetical protein